MFGIKHFAAVINPPHATILAVGAGEQRPVVQDGALGIATVMTLHALDRPPRRRRRAGRANCMAAFKQIIEDPLC